MMLAVDAGTTAISREDLRAIAAACLRAPSGDNCQPWRFAWDGESLAIHHDEERARHPINRGGYGSLLALGCVLESAALAAGALGLRAEIGYADLALGLDACARIRFVVDPALAADPLAAAIDARCTDRRIYLGGAIDATLAAGLAGDAVGAARVVLAPLDDEVIAYARRAESSLLADPEALSAVISWVRFGARDARARRDGMSPRNLGARWFEIPLLRLLRACPGLVRPLAACGSRGMQERLIERQLRSSAGLILVAVSDASRATVVDAGRAAMRAWLRLTAAGHGVQPLSLSSLNAYLAAATDLIPRANASFFRAGGALLARASGLRDGELPLWMFRAGISPRLPTAMRTLRRPIDEVLTSAR